MLSSILRALHIVSIGLLVWLSVAKGHISRNVNKLEVQFSLLEKNEIVTDIVALLGKILEAQLLPCCRVSLECLPHWHNQEISVSVYISLNSFSSL